MQLLDRLIEAEHLQQAWKIVGLLESRFLHPARAETRMSDVDIAESPGLGI